MKMFKKHSLTLGLSCFAIALSAMSPAHATSSDGVSAVGIPTPPPVETPPQADSSVPPQPIAVSPPPVTPEPVPYSPSASAVPSTTAITPTTPVAAPSDPLTPIPQDAADGSIRGTNVMGDSGVVQKHSGTYYDSNAIVPDRDLEAVGATGPRKVDPALEPGQKFVVVNRTGSAGSFESQYIAATRALKLERYSAAMEMFEKLYKKNHKDPRVLMGLAVAQQGAGFRESAVKTYEDLLKVQPNNADAIINLMGIMRSQYPSVTLKKLAELRGKYPNNPGIPAQMGLINADLENYDDAIRDMEIAASMDPGNPSHVYNMAIITDRGGNASRAIKLYEQALQMDAARGATVGGLPREEIYDRLVVLRRKV